MPANPVTAARVFSVKRRRRPRPPHFSCFQTVRSALATMSANPVIAIPVSNVRPPPDRRLCRRPCRTDLFASKTASANRITVNSLPALIGIGAAAQAAMGTGARGRIVPAGVTGSAAPSAIGTDSARGGSGSIPL